MGLLPAHSGDWLDFPENPERVEYASGGFNFQSATFEIATPTKPGYQEQQQLPSGGLGLTGLLIGS